ncbi:unnamed protein product [Rotaria sp. Silwood1]|nr:unnamed protein product [Rotaria sp. Silwood1]CAF1533124.1 unnamed protein product [Rotaria sp. Silwood1]CAF3672851.1 unnamed protein product [Rotaria sp. Silwood1]CAF4689653.1 unnamed protein product [Rotaria sp. Silwood1]
MYNPNINAPYGYAQLSPLVPSPISRIPKQNAAGGKTLIIIISVLAATIFIGMILGLGLGIGAAGLISNIDLTNTLNPATVTNTSSVTNTTSVTNSTG